MRYYYGFYFCQHHHHHHQGRYRPFAGIGLIIQVSEIRVGAGGAIEALGASSAGDYDVTRRGGCDGLEAPAASVAPPVGGG